MDHTSGAFTELKFIVSQTQGLDDHKVPAGLASLSIRREGWLSDLSPGRADGCLLQKSLYPLLSVSEFVLISLFVRKMLNKY